MTGRALGIDLSAQMLDHARRLSREEGLANVSFLQADAQVHRFPAASFEVAISRFGTMFFADPVAAFGNIGHALSPGGRLVLMVWQARDRNEWTTAVREALAGDNPLPPPPADGPNPFSLADPAVAGGILTAAGFAEISFTDVREPVYYGPDSAVALDVVSGLRSTRDLLAGLEAGEAERALSVARHAGRAPSARRRVLRAPFLENARPGAAAEVPAHCRSRAPVKWRRGVPARDRNCFS